MQARSLFSKMIPDVVYDVQLLQSLQEQLCNGQILKEVLM